MFSKTELNILADLLDLAGDKFSNHGCNDFEIENNLLTRQIAQDFWRWETDEFVEYKDGETICLSDSSLMKYFAEKINNHLKEVNG